MALLIMVLKAGPKRAYLTLRLIKSDTLKMQHPNHTARVLCQSVYTSVTQRAQEGQRQTKWNPAEYLLI